MARTTDGAFIYDLDGNKIEAALLATPVPQAQAAKRSTAKKAKKAAPKKKALKKAPAKKAKKKAKRR